MATASSFSYAQAAKGQNGPATQEASSTASAQTETTVVSSTNETSASTTESVPEVQPISSSTDSQPAASEKVETESVSAVGSESRAESVHERRSDAKKDEELGRLERPWRRNDKGTRSSSATTRSVDEQESRRPRKGKKGKAADKNASETSASAEQEQDTEPEAPKIELAEAPIPSVNIWHQRKEAHLAKAKPDESDASNEATQGVAKPSEAERTVASDVNGVKPAEKSGESSKPERNGSRGSRVAAKEARNAAPPPVQDASLWPTPETVIQEDKKKTPTDKSADKSDKESVDDGSQSKQARPKKEWVAYDYVPTVSFETQLPQMRGSKPRGGAKGANSSRANAGAQPSEKPSNVVTPKTTESKDRPKDGANGSNRSAPAPASSKRPSGEGAASRAEQRKQASSSGPEKTKDTPAGHQPEQAHSGREARGERGRGGYRGRAGHHAVNSQSQHQHNAAAAPFQAQGAVGSRAQGHYSPPTRQGGHGHGYVPPAQRGGRGARNGGNNWHRPSIPNGSSRAPAVQPQYQAYDYSMQPMAAVPFQQQPQQQQQQQQQPPYWDNMMVSLLRSQLEYYFSIENLCKDLYLRQRMDSQGFVPLMFIAAFKRMRELSPDTSLIRSVCEESAEIDYVVGEDDCERLRRRHGWASFVLPMEERDELARNHGPQHITYKSRNFAFAPQFNGMPPAPYGIPSPHNYAVQGSPVPAPMGDEHHQLANGVNGFVNGNGVNYGVNTQLSAEVPDFAPSGPSNKLEAGLTNGHFVPAAVNGLPNGNHSHE